MTAVMLAISLISSAQIPTIYCGVYKSTSWGTTLQRGIYSFPAQNNTTFTKVSTAENDNFLAPLGGAAVYDGVMHGVHYTSGEIYGQTYYTFTYVEYDTKTWTQTKKKSVPYNNIAARCNVSIDPTTGKVWGLFNNFDLDYNIVDRKWATVDYATLSKTVIDAMSLNMVALAIDNSGQAYAVGTDAKLYAIDKATTAYTAVGSTGVSIKSGYPMCAAVDPVTNKMYWSAVLSDGTSGLYELNKATGAATLVSKYPGNEVVVNMWIPAPEAADDAPAAVTNLKLDFKPNALTGNVNFKVPATTYAGAQLSGNLTYAIKANGVALVTGETTAAGADVSKQVTIDKAGITEVEVVVSNAAGDGPKQSVKQWIGPDTPTAPTGVNWTYDAASHQAKLTWTAPVMGKNNAPLDTAALTYNVVRQPGNVTVAKGLDATAFAESLSQLTDLKSYYYQVTPVNGSLVGDKAESNHIVLGDALGIPYSENFYNKNNFDLFTVIDANDDGATWKYKATNYQYSDNQQYASIVASKTLADDDWLLTPPLKMEKKYRYKIAYKVKKQYSPSDYNQLLDVGVGQGTDVNNYKSIVELMSINVVSFTEVSRNFVVPADGVYHIGFHATSKAKSDELCLDDINVTVAGLQGDVNGDGKVDVSDITAVIQTILGTAQYSVDVCDINGDGAVNIDDVTTLINMM